ncbi:MAG: phosphotransferase [Candidatus Electrothrix aestuarii]|uniref:Phosphotransferase n=1 Tax=Candidatus Electrothrix aestuarii TaxID=3062594 RepID=A0AAU8LRC6_9BACT|nr:phosphotransferase [Candidatus Electrothrix aestuarii]
MFLTATNIVHYLLAKGLVTTESVVDGDFIVSEAGRRNRNFMITRNQSPGIFVKQIKNFEPETIATIQQEGSCYRFINSSPLYEPIKRLMPPFIDYDDTRYILTLELLPGSENLNEYHNRLESFPDSIGRMIGEGIGTYHSDVGRMFSNTPNQTLFPKKAPWILSFHQSNGAMFQQLSQGNSKLLELLHQYPEFQSKLDELRNEWQYDSLIHGDIKWDNFIVFNNEDEKPEFRIIDWELVDFGDSCWDVGGVFQAYLFYWILSMPFENEDTISRSYQKAKFKIEEMHPSIKAFWDSYTKSCRMNNVEKLRTLSRSIRFGAARMVQTAFEYLFYSQGLNNRTLALLQVSFNILKSPEKAASALLGLKL